MSKERELLERTLFQFGKWHMQAEYDWDSENDLKEEIRAYLAEPEVKREPLSDEEMSKGFIWYGPKHQVNQYEIFKLGVRFAEKHHPAPRSEFVRLSEEEVTEILTSAYDMYAAICAVENRLVEKNRG